MRKGHKLTASAPTHTIFREFSTAKALSEQLHNLLLLMERRVMVMFIFKKKLFASIICTIIVLSAPILLGFSFALPVLAETATPTLDFNQSNMEDSVLEQLYSKELLWLASQQKHLDQSDAVLTKVQDLIDTAGKTGIDVTALGQTLESFKTQITSAQKSHDNAKTLLSERAGFDKNGKVADSDAAKRTLFNSRNSLQDARILVASAVSDMRKALNYWAQDNQSPDRTTSLETAFEEEKAFLAAQQSRLDNTIEVAASLDKLIIKAREENKDTSDLETAFKTYQTQLDKAKNYQKEAASILENHIGFGADGKVNSTLDAQKTLLDTKTAMTNTHDILAQAVKDLQEAINTWKSNTSTPGS
jgi:hypothetical protein